MSSDDAVGACNNTVIRKAARNLTKFYDACMADTSLRATQYAILSVLSRSGSTTVANLAALLTLDRTTMGHNLRPLARDGLVSIKVGREDRREREIALTARGRRREAASRPYWLEAQRRFEEEFGVDDALAMRRVMTRVAQMSLGIE
jgi:DNA-binding MarR family transcriptional regulator